MVHRARQGFVEARTATINRLRGLLSELGIVLPLKAATVRREAAGDAVRSSAVKQEVEEDRTRREPSRCAARWISLA